MPAPPEKPGEGAAALVEEGLREAAAISHPLMRARHRHAWALRLSRVDADRAAAMAEELDADPLEQSRFLLTVLTDRLSTPNAQRPTPNALLEFDRVLRMAANLEPHVLPSILNALSEIAVGAGDADPELARALLGRMPPVIEALPIEDEPSRQTKALACALVGEAMLFVGEDVRGVHLLHEADALSREIPGREALGVFLATALAERDPERAAELAGAVEQLETRLDLRIQLIEKLTPGELREGVVTDTLADAARLDQMQHLPLSQSLVRLALALAPSDGERARALFREALEQSAESFGQTRALQLAGVATAAASLDREWAGTLFHEADAAAAAEGDVLKQVTTRVLIANEMAQSHPREAAAIFEAAMAEAAGLDAAWEFAHLLDIVFHAERSPYLDTRAALPVLEAALSRISDEDPRVPGVFGLPEVGQHLAQVAPDRAAAVFQRWFAAAEESADTDGMIRAALMLHRVDAPQGLQALRAVRDYLLVRVDCPSMGDFCRSAASVSPALALEVAPHIPDPREQGDALTAAAVELHPSDPEGSLQLIRSLPRPADRSGALLAVADRLLGTGDRYLPQPLLEDMP